MFHHLLSYYRKLTLGLRKAGRFVARALKHYWRKGFWHKLAAVFICLVLLSVGGMYGIARWYMWSERNVPLTLGASFSPDYAASLGVDPHAALHAMLTDLHIRELRLDSYWSDMQPTANGSYDFSQLDWQMHEAEAAHAKVILAVGLRQPGWPECHMPTWAANEPADTWQPQLTSFITAVVNRYKTSPSLQSYQVENEYFLQGFGVCTNFSRQRLVDEYQLVKRLDPSHSAIVARSNNALGTPLGQPVPDSFSISIYKRVWFHLGVQRYLEYPFPAWYYGFLAGVQKITTGRDMIVGELQAEAWTPFGKTIPETSLAEQNRSITAARLQQRFVYGQATGMKTIMLWGAEYWYYRMVQLHDPSLWNVARTAYVQAQTCHQNP